ncbi:mechanosensitive ion channel family protein [Azospirillum sp. RWY-5-1]|uniref:Mechanosensitive ion channel family protein n=1 Tax=Azospirillum oleiclasticum TaxID=2735135 RepID=A0ABX2T794_9PROT|nr:mechanosensitive ion channel family protein [Azospirillum oleiclasticum]NYZ13137.1 mechanosensitive ion channel family protein [Azospirillum oleiclasticum]NYZ20190.1 mechanosensitive ion channel family protein [Azospirillum oleiclasticum]
MRWFAAVRAFGAALALLFLASGGTSPGAAQTASTATPPADAAPAKVQELVRLLGDPAVQAWITRAMPPAEAPATDQPMMLTWRIDRVKERIARLTRAVERFPAELREAAEIMSFELDLPTGLHTAGAVATFLALGFAAETLFRRWTRHARERLAEPLRGRLSARLARTALRVLLALLGVGIFTLASAGTFMALSWPPILGLLTFTTLLWFIAVRLARAVSERVLAPDAPALRLLPVGDEAARRLHAGVGVLAFLGAGGALLTQALHELGLMRDSRLVIPCAVGLAVAVLAIALVWWTSGGNRRAAEGEDGLVRRLGGAMAELWPVLATLLIAATWVAFVADAIRIAWTLAVIGGTAGGILLARGFVASVTADGDEPSPWLPTLRRTVGVTLLLAGVAALSAIWDVGGVMGGDVRPVWQAVFRIVVALLIADLVWTATRTAIDHRLGPAASGSPMPDDSEGGEASGPEARLKTLLPLVRAAILVALVVVIGLVVLSALGIDIAPFLAGAGILGLAVGFGSQALVRDIVSGFFFLVEDAFRVGEYVEFGNLRGTVEGISLRSMRLRHHLGAVHTVPYGEIKSLTNHSRDWTMVRLEFRLPFETDLTQVKKIVKRIGAEMAVDPEYAPDFIQPLKSQGVRRWEEFNMVVGVKFTTRPGKQWVIRRDAYQRIRDAFEKAGIRFASRDVTVRVDSAGQPLSPAEAAAAQAAIDAVPRPPQPATAEFR